MESAYGSRTSSGRNVFATSLVRGALRHSAWDALPLVLSLAHGVALLAWPTTTLIALGLWWNANTIAHQFIHLPYFRSSRLNRVYSIYLTLVLGFPQTLWRERHLAHHAGVPHRLRLTTPFIYETTVVLSLWLLLALNSSQFFWTVYVPGYAVGLGLCYLQGHFEHARETTSHYGSVYNFLFFNDGYHVEHHASPAEHWTRLPHRAASQSQGSRWPAILRWLEYFRVEALEELALRSRMLQEFLLSTHERALRRHLPELQSVRTIEIVGGGMFPRTALLLQRLLPEAELTIVDASPQHIRDCQRFLSGNIRFVHRFFEPGTAEAVDLVVIPLAFVGNREALYREPPAPFVLIHDWIWFRRGASVVVSPWLLKRMNLVRRD